MADSDLMSRPASVVSHDTKTRRLTVRLLRWDDWRTVSDGGRPYRERFARGSLVPLERLWVKNEHGGQLIGRMDPPTDGGDGPVATVHIAHTSAGDDLLALVDSNVVDAVSIEFMADAGGEIWDRARTEVTRTRAILGGLAFAFNPAHDAAILARQRQAATNPALRQMSEELTGLRAAIAARSPSISKGPRPMPQDLHQADQEHFERAREHLLESWRARDPGTAAAHRGEAVLELRHVEELERLRHRLDPYFGRPSRYLGDVLDSGRGGSDRLELHRALTDVTTGDITGILRHPTIVPDGLSFDPATACPFVTMYGQPGPAAHSYSVPTWQVPTAGQQLTEKAEVTSGTLSIGETALTAKGFAFGNDVAIQAIHFTDDVFVGFYISLLTAGVNKLIESYALGQLTAGLTATATTRATLVDDVLAAMGAVSAFVGFGPANVVAAGTDAGPILGYELGRSSMVGLPRVVITTGLAPDLVLVTHRLAFAVVASPPELMKAANVPALGTDVAAYRYVAAGRIVAGASAVVLQLGTT